MAENCCAAPVRINGFAGVTAIDCKVGATLVMVRALVAVTTGLDASLT